jgi:hypothetical protein
MERELAGPRVADLLDHVLAVAGEDVGLRERRRRGEFVRLQHAEVDVEHVAVDDRLHEREPFAPVTVLIGSSIDFGTLFVLFGTMNGSTSPKRSFVVTVGTARSSATRRRRCRSTSTGTARRRPPSRRRSPVIVGSGSSTLRVRACFSSGRSV